MTCKRKKTYKKSSIVHLYQEDEVTRERAQLEGS